jgi:hypothetical protein
MLNIFLGVRGREEEGRETERKMMKTQIYEP